MNKLLFLLLIQSFLNALPSDFPDRPAFLTTSTVQLRIGWNLVSSPTNDYFDTNLITKTDNKTLWSFSNSDPKPKWSSSYGQKMPAGKGFWVKMKENETISFNRIEGFEPYDMVVKTGWNLLGMSAYYGTRARDLLIRLDGITIWIFKWSSRDKRYIWEEKGKNTSNFISRGQGFWLKK